MIAFTRSNWTVATHLRYIPKSILDPTKVGPEQAGYNITSPISANVHTVSPAFYADLSASISLPRQILGAKPEIYAALNNIGDTEPPPQLRLFGNPLQYDAVGRSFRLGLRAAW